MTSGISELVLVVSDVRRSAGFYRDTVGLRAETEPTEEWAWFWTGIPNRSARLGLRRGPLLFEEHSPLPEGRRFGPVHFALTIPRGDLAAALARIRSAHVEVYGPQRFEWMRAVSYYCYDPDANLVEFWSPDAEDPL